MSTLFCMEDLCRTMDPLAHDKVAAIGRMQKQLSALWAQQHLLPKDEVEDGAEDGAAPHVEEPKEVGDTRKAAPRPPQIRKILTSLDVEKNRRLLRSVEIEPPWTVGLIINQATHFDSQGTPLVKRKRKKRVRCLTIIFITSLELDEVERLFNTPGSVPTPTLRTYCGFLPVVIAIRGFPDFASARRAFCVWKERTRGPNSRFFRGQVLVRELRREGLPLEYFVIKKPQEEKIRSLHELYGVTT